jgi:hypothetical protein
MNFFFINDITLTIARAVRLYEQKPGKTCFALSRLGKYVQGWIK